MAQTIKLRRSATQGGTPTTSQLSLGEVAINTYDGKLYIKKDNGTESIVEIGGASSGGLPLSGGTMTGDIALGDNVKATFGAADDLEIYHDGSNSVIADTGTGSLNIKGAVNLYYNNSLRLQTGATGNYLAGTTILDALNVALPIEANGIALGDNDKATFGAGDDLQIYHDGSNSRIKDSGTGDLFIQGSTNVQIEDASGANMIFATSGGSVKLFHNALPKIETTSTGIDVTGVITTDGIALGDNDKALFGAGDDLQIYHDGSNSYISDQGTGSLRITAQDFRVRNSDNNAAVITGLDGAGVFLYHNGSEKLTTTATGIDVTGTATMDGLTVEAASNALIRISDSTNANQRLDLEDNGGIASIISGNNGAYGVIKLQGYNGTDTVDRFKISANGDISFYEDTGTTAKMVWDASAKKLTLSGTSYAHPLLSVDNASTGGHGAYIGTSGYTNAHYALSVNRDSGKQALRVDGLGDVSFYDDTGTTPKMVWDASAELLTTTGLDVTGTATMDGLTVANSTGSIIKLESTGTGLGAGATIGDLQFFGNDLSTPGAGVKASITATTVASLGDDAQLMFSTSDGTTNNINRLLIANNGDISFYEDTGTTPKFFWDASAESLGIGTTSPATALDVNSGSSNKVATFTSTDATAFIQIEDSNTTSSAHGYGVNGNNLSLYANDSERLRIDSSGKVGIGTSSPARELSIGDGTGSPNIQLLAASAGNSRIEFGDTDDSDAGEIQYVHSDNYMQFTTNGSEKMRIDSSGNVGIGTDSPARDLVVKGSIPHVSILANTNTQDCFLDFGDEDDDNKGRIVYANSDDSLAFYSNASEKMRIDSSGNVGIGTSSPSQKLDVSSAGTTRIQVKNTNLTSSGLYIAEDSNGAQFNELGAYPMRFHTNGTERLRIDSSGNVGIGTSSPSSSLTTAADSGVLVTDASGLRQIEIVPPQTSNGFAGEVGTRSYHPLVFNTFSTERMRIDASGNVGIGTDSPQRTLHLKDDVAGIRLEDSDNNSYGELIYNIGSNGLLLRSDEGNTDAGSNIIFEVDGSEGMRIDSSGNLLVGKTSASSATVGFQAGQDGFIAATRASGQPLVLNRTTTDGIIADFRKDSTTVGSIGVVTSDNLYIQGNSSHNGLAFGSNALIPFKNSAYTDNVCDIGGSSNRFKDLYLSGAANVGSIALGDNDKATFGVSDDLEIYHNGSHSYVTDTGTGNLFIGGSSYVDIGNGATGMGGQTYARFNVSGACQLNYNGSDKLKTLNNGANITGSLGINTTSPSEELHVVGDIIATGNITAFFSDERLKDFQGTIPDALDKVNSLNGYYFTPNDTALGLGVEDKGVEVGISAQEVEAVLPEIVTDSAVGEGYKTVWYEKLTPLLIEAVKELTGKVDNLEARLKELEK